MRDLILLLCVFSIAEADWGDHYFNVAQSATSQVSKQSDGDGKVLLEFDEEVEVPFTLGEFTYTGGTLKAFPANYFDVKSNNGRYELYSKFKFDYESGNSLSNTITILYAEDSIEMVVTIRNINDNKMEIKAEPCTIEEGPLDGSQFCDSYKISDKDGISTELELNQLDPVHEAIFKFECQTPCVNGEKEATIRLSALKELDYEIDTRYNFDWTVSDDLFEDIERVQINVKDMPDEKPVWTTIHKSIEIVDKVAQTLTFKAVDGDTQINDPIKYDCKNRDKPLDVKMTCATKDGTLELVFGEIDRDADNLNILTFEVSACETNPPKDCIEDKIVILIDDVNDNWPDITLSTNDIELRENSYDTINIAIQIKDLDLGEAGTFEVKLECDDEIAEVKDALQVIPGTGYRTGSFALSIINATILDYDRTDGKLREFEIEIVATEKKDEGHVGNKKLTIHLINWNDHEPIFKKDSYILIDIPEDFGRFESRELPLVDLIATDDDIGDSVTYALVGSINNVFEIKQPENDGEGPKILTKVDADPNVQLLDYEKQKEVRFQVEASDNFDANLDPKKNRKYAELTIKLVDVNDEPPVITLSPSTISIKENQPDDTILEVEIKVSDPDEMPELKVEIDWTKSYATKYNVQKPIFKDDYTGSFELREVSKGQQEATYEIRIKEVVADNTPDYEEFDNIYVYLVVTDEAQTIGKRTSEVILIITVVNINDNKPTFITEITDKAKKVKENAKRDDTVGMVAAEDKDVTDELTYSLEPLNEYSDGKIAVGEKTGMLTVSDENIDAEELYETLKLTKLEYKVCVSDGDVAHKICVPLDIEVDDENDNPPYFVVEPQDTHIEEHLPVETKVVTIEAHDNDRDDPNNKITYTIEPTEFFSISEVGEIKIRKQLDREKMEYVEVKVTIVDNPDIINTQKKDEARFKIILDDINDQVPILLTDEITASENTNEGEVIAIVDASDGDEMGTDNAKIKFNILGIDGCYKELKESFFEISTDEDYTSWKGTIVAKKSLRKMYSESGCKIKIETEDFGTNPKKQKSVKEIPFIIEKYNFDPPVFVFPNKPSIYLLSGQQFGNKVLLHDGMEMQPISAKHERDGKYGINFFLADDSDGHDAFELKKTTETSAHLYLKRDYDDKRTYNLKIVTEDNGQPQKSSRYEVKIGFYDTNKEPVFESNDRQREFTFDEGEGGVGAELVLPKATLQVDDEEIIGDLEIYYHIYKDVDNAFDMKDNADPPVIELIKPLLVLDDPSREVQVVATKSANNVPTNVDEASIITIRLNVIDINNNPPVFEEDQYSSGVMQGYQIERIVETVNATDVDDDGNVLKYSILMDTYEANVDGITGNNHFKLDELTGEIKLNFEVLQNMKGYFAFDVEVTDSLHKVSAKVKIYIISDANEVAIRFDNTYNEVISNRQYIQDVFSDVLDYGCSVHGVNIASDENGSPIEDVTEVKVHCVDSDSNLPVSEADVKAKMNNAETIGNLKEQLRERSLRIANIREVVVPENKEEQLKIWLVCVAVVLGSLCVVLILAFILKTRSLLSRIDKLTTVDFADNEKHLPDSNINIPAAPNTNRRAVEGSNPVFNTNMEDKEDALNFDNQSISSGDSDFLGIENNPVFD